jgi:hypothetical protein
MNLHSFQRAVRFSLFAKVTAIDLVALNPCKLMCHMEHSLDACKLVATSPTDCSNFFWVDDSKSATVVDRVAEPEYVTVTPIDCVRLLRVGANGCAKVCAGHELCREIGSECKNNGVCLNLFWNPGPLIREEMTWCYGLSDEGCFDGIPILCEEDSMKRSPRVYENRSRDPIPSMNRKSKTEIASSGPLELKFIHLSVTVPILLLLIIPGFTRI